MAEAVEVECESNAIDSWLEDSHGVEAGQIGF
jgi:hypothetical protein